jgi:ABC-2 type transport system permease protein
MMGFLRSAYVIGRRDFTATVYSKSFLFFLISPLIIIAISVLFGTVTQNAARQNMQTTVAVVAGKAEYDELAASRDRLVEAFEGRTLPELSWYEPDYNLKAQTDDLLRSSEKRIVAVLTGGIAKPTLTGPIDDGSLLRRQIAVIIDDARQQRAVASSGHELQPAKVAIVPVARSGGALATMRAMTATAGQFILFFLTVFLAGMLLSNLLEEKSNKVIEVLAAAVPVNAIFVGKIFSMLAISLVAIAVWGVGGVLAATISSGGMLALPEPAVGWPLFVLLVLIYYSANYLLLGAMFLGIGSQASTVREIQTLSMPITVGQMLIFLFASIAAANINGFLGITAAIFPLSSPLTMVARAAQSPQLWTHLVAILWQAVWVWLIVMLGAAWFRRNVLKSGSPVLAKPR